MVATGPLAIAGSTPKRSKTQGDRLGANVAIIEVERIVKATTAAIRPRPSSSRNPIHAAPPIVSAINNPSEASRYSCLKSETRT